jgi:hypothetical protein
MPKQMPQFPPAYAPAASVANPVAQQGYPPQGYPPMPKQMPQSPLPPGWEELREPSGRVYYGNPAMKIVQFDRPLHPTAAAGLTGASTIHQASHANNAALVAHCISADASVVHLKDVRYPIPNNLLLMFQSQSI